jgi:organic hydroperoxide reductase OsmC/OhrA
MDKAHQYNLTLAWTGNSGSGTKDYRSYERSYSISIDGKAEIQGSSDPAFRGDASKYNPEELLLASLSSCHMLWFLHLCSANAIVVTAYVDEPSGTMMEEEDGSGKFKEVILNPVVTIKDEKSLDKLDAIHVEANRCCFIANSVNFPVKHFAKAKVDS